MPKKGQSKGPKPTPKKTGGVAASAERLARPVVEGFGLRLWDVRFEKEGPEWFLRILIDRDEPLDTDTCEKVSRAVDPLLDEADLIDQGYYLEVGSPGLGRKLTRAEHFAWMAGQDVEVRFYAPDEEGRKSLKGVLLGKEDGNIRLRTAEGDELLEEKKVSVVKLADDEDLFR